MEEFKKGDTVLYGRTDVCRIESYTNWFEECDNNNPVTLLQSKRTRKAIQRLQRFVGYSGIVTSVEDGTVTVKFGRESVAIGAYCLYVC
jgi:hypothetical protein